MGNGLEEYLINLSLAHNDAESSILFGVLFLNTIPHNKVKRHGCGNADRSFGPVDRSLLEVYVARLEWGGGVVKGLLLFQRAEHVRQA